MTELNERLYKWAGYKPHLFPDGLQMGWKRPDGEWVKNPPYFPGNLNACFKWLVPLAVSELRQQQIFTLTNDNQAYRALFKRWLDKGHDAQALCLAIDKLIDSEVRP